MGQAWRVHFSRTGVSCDVVVAQADETGYRQGASCEGAGRLMAADAAFGWPWLGEFGPDLEGLTPRGEVRFYDWPLADGKSWETTWEGEPARVEATFVPDLAGEGGFALRMHRVGQGGSGGALVATYDYVPSLGWWSEMKLASGWRMQARSLDREAPAEVVLAQAEERLVVAYGVGVDLTPSTFAMEEDEGLVVLHYVLGAPSTQRITLTRPDREVAHGDAFSPMSDPVTRSVFVDSMPGTWQLDVTRAGAGGAAFTVHAVRLYAFSLR